MSEAAWRYLESSSVNNTSTFVVIEMLAMYVDVKMHVSNWCGPADTSPPASSCISSSADTTDLQGLTTLAWNRGAHHSSDLAKLIEVRSFRRMHRFPGNHQMHFVSREHYRNGRARGSVNGLYSACEGQQGACPGLRHGRHVTRHTCCPVISMAKCVGNFNTPLL